MIRTAIIMVAMTTAGAMQAHSSNAPVVGKSIRDQINEATAGKKQASKKDWFTNYFMSQLHAGDITVEKQDAAEAKMRFMSLVSAAMHTELGISPDTSVVTYKRLDGAGTYQDSYGYVRNVLMLAGSINNRVQRGLEDAVDIAQAAALRQSFAKRDNQDSSYRARNY